MFNFQKINKIQKILCYIDMQNFRVFGNSERGLYRTEAEKIAKELKKSTNLEFIKLSVENVFRESFEDDYVYDPEKIERIGFLINDFYNNRKRRFLR